MLGNREIHGAGSYTLPGSFISVFVYVCADEQLAGKHESTAVVVVVHQFADKCR